ncbi:MAG TPA: alpha-L-fucosidase [Opitutaceae bacterium]|nr:alpha-L-fucosidase [Opitutaceae bacterium]
MNSKKLLALIFLGAAASRLPAADSTPAILPATPPIRMAPASAGLPPLPAVVRDETQAQQDARLQWFRAARFGMFIHWGVYAVPAGFWQGKPVGAEWIMHQGKIPVADYRAFAKNFTAEKYDPEAWARLIADAGMKYVVITAKHHDGFALYESAHSDWTAAKSSGAKRDLIGPLAEAVRARGIKFGTYYSQAQDWINPGGSTGRAQPWDPAQKGDFDEYLAKVSLPQVREILEKFQPDILWWDTEYQMTSERARPFFDLVVSHPKLIHNSRLGGGVLGDFRTSEQRIPASAMLGRALEVNMTINNSWGYRTDDLNWKSAQTLIRNLSDITSKDGNYLLNVGPTAEGVIPEPCVERLHAIGRWLKTNGEAIYATRGSVYPAPLTWGRTTQKAKPGGGTTLFLHIWEWPADGKILLPDIKQAPRSGRLLAGGIALAATATPEGIVVTLPGAAPDPDVSVAALEFDQPVVVLNAAPLPSETGASGTLADPSKSPPAH